MVLFYGEIIIPFVIIATIAYVYYKHSKTHHLILIIPYTGTNNNSDGSRHIVRDINSNTLYAVYDLCLELKRDMVFVVTPTYSTVMYPINYTYAKFILSENYQYIDIVSILRGGLAHKL